MTIQFTPRQARFLYLFEGLAPVATNIITPMVVSARLRHKEMPPERKKEIVLQEVARQMVSGGIGLVFYFGGGALVQKSLDLLMKRSGSVMSEAARQIARIIGATMANFVGYGYVRPLISTELIVRWLNKAGGPLQLQPLTPPPVEARRQDFFASVQNRSANQFRGLA